MIRILLASATTALALLVTSCADDPHQGYSFSQSFRTDVKTISVPVWHNNTFYPGLDAKLGQALVAEINKTTPYRVTSGDGATSVLEGTIVSAEMKKLSTGRESGLVQELSFEIVVDFTWKDNRTGKVLTARKNFSAARSFAPARGVGERIDVGEDAAAQQLAKDIIGEMRSGW
ncbi:MAG: LptE family protein [Phycisphaerales bacterium]